jgi:hypothetical protein
MARINDGAHMQSQKLAEYNPVRFFSGALSEVDATCQESKMHIVILYLVSGCCADSGRAVKWADGFPKTKACVGQRRPFA